MRGRVRDKAYVNFHSQKQWARLRGIEFEFSFVEWRDWWIRNLGQDWLKLRGPKGDQYVMARLGDRGPYAAGNVKCITASQNVRERKAIVGEAHYAAKITAQQVAQARAEYVPHSRQHGARSLARKYGVCIASMTQCLRGDTWASVEMGGGLSPG